MLKFRDVFGRCKEGRLSKLEAAELLGINERTFRRWCQRYEEEGEAGLVDRRLGKPSPQRVPAAEAEEVGRLYRERYQGFTAKHFHEHLVQSHSFRWGYSWTKTYLQNRHYIDKALRRGAHRRKRPRKPLPGMMLHQDGSRHQWIPGFDHALDLIITLDDATNELYSAFLAEEEGTFSSLRGLADVFASHGLPLSIYTDRGSHYFFTPTAGGKVDSRALTQVGRALAQLGIEHIAAYSPQARGRCERIFRTLQDRLPKELALAGIADMPAANRFIADAFLPAYNARFSIAAAEPGSAFVPVGLGQWQDVLCVQEERVVANDNTVAFQGLRLQIPPSRLRPHFVKARVRVHQYCDGTHGIFHGPQCLARYDCNGRVIQETVKWAA
ncbi:MAG TPA: ISNCY family transposase [Xanthobacteraceae bacterium]|jgi:transposase